MIWAHLADARAVELIAGAVVGRARVLGGADAFPYPADDAEPCATVVDASRPETPDDQGARLRALLAACPADGRVVTTACAGPPAGRVGARTLSHLLALLSDAGATPVRVVPFDFFGPCSPWRLGLGARRDAVMAELEVHLGFRAVRRAVRLLERTVVAGLPAEWAGRALVVAVRGDAVAPPLPSPPDPRAIAARLLRLAQDDAVLRWLAFLDAAVLSPAGAPVDVARWLGRLGAVPSALLVPGRWRWPGYEVYRFLETAGLRMAQATSAALADTAPDADARTLAPTLEYDLAETFHGLFDACLEARA